MKLEVVTRKLAGESTMKLVREYDLSGKHVLQNWVKQYKNGNTTFEEKRGKATKKDSPLTGRKKIIKREEMTNAEYIKYLEMENDILKKTYEVGATTGSNKYVKYEVIKILSSKYPITALSEYLCASTSTYYLYLKRNPIKYDNNVSSLIYEIYNSRKSAGYRTITMVLRRKHNLHVNHKKVLRIMQHLNIKGKQNRRKYKFDKALQKSRIFDNVLQRNFLSNKSNEKWSIDITYIPDRERNTYLVCIKDLYDKRIVSFRNSNNMCEEFVLECVKEALDNNNIVGNLILHSYQGTHFTTNTYIKLLDKYKVTGSHSRKGNCHDNAPIESFFSIFKREAFNFNVPDNFLQTKKFIDYYNYEREQYGFKKKLRANFTPHRVSFLFCPILRVHLKKE